MATILLVDDDKDLRAGLRPVLEADDHRVVEAGDGEEAIDCWRSLTFDLIITNLVMPRMNGQEVIQIVATHQPTFPIILMSSGIEADVLLCIRHRFPSVLYLPKQLIRSHLRDYVREALA